MKNILIVICILFSLSLGAKNIYTAPTGNDNNSGSISSPLKTLNQVWKVVAAGDTVYMRGGTYSLNVQQYLSGKSGTASAKIYIWAYPGEKVIITKGSPYSNNYYRGGCYFEGNYTHWKGIRITGFTQTDSYVWNGLLVMNSSNNIFENLEVDNNGAGMYVQGSSTGNLILNSDFHHNYDPITHGGNADGLDVAYLNPGTNNTVRGCRAWSNSDDGFDAFENLGFIWFENCWSWDNGNYKTGSSSNGVGFKLGTTGSGNGSTKLRKITNCIAFANRLSGFHQEEGDCIMELTHNAAYLNGEHGFLFNWQNRSHIIDSNYSFNNTENNAVISLNSTNKNNAYGGNYAGNTSTSNWQNIVTAADFISLSYIGVDGARGIDGSLPNLSFLKLASNSDLLSKGIGPFGVGIVVPPPPPTPTKTLWANIRVYSDRTISMAKSQNPNKLMLFWYIIYVDNNGVYTIEKQ